MTSPVLESKYKDGPVVLVSRPIEYTFPLAYAYLAGYLLENGERPVVLFRTVDPAELVRQILDLKPLLVGFGGLFPEMQEIASIISMLNGADRSFPIVVGGHMVSPTPEFSVEISGADLGVGGEGEITLLRLVQALRHGGDLSSVAGLVIRDGDRFLDTGPGEYIHDLSKLPRIPYEFFPESEWLAIGRWYATKLPQTAYWRLGDRVISVHGARGCPYRCNFCYHSSRPRYRPVTNMMEEAAETLDRYQANVLYFSDDLVLTSPKRCREIIDGIRSLDRRVTYTVSTRFDILNRLDDDLLAELSETGCRTVGLGIESGSDRILEIIGKRCTAEMIEDGLERLRKHGLLPSVAIMVGQDEETVEDVEASIRLLRNALSRDPNVTFGFTITTPFPGSPLYDKAIKNGLIRDHRDFYDRYFATSSDMREGDWNQVANLSRMSDETVVKMHRKISAVYLEEKERLLHPEVQRIEKLQNKTNAIYNRLSRAIEERMPRSQTRARALGAVDWTYDWVLKAYERKNLRYRLSR